MATALNKSDPANGTVNLTDGQLNSTSTSLSFLGKNYSQSYTQPIGENFLHLLENFAFSSPPINPVQGQLWFNNNDDLESDSVSDNSRDSYGLKIYDGTSWLPVGIIKKFSENPSLTSGGTNLKTGDLYVDTERQQLYINNGNNGWTLVGPTFNAAEKTGAEIEYVDDADAPVKRPILSIFVKTKRVVIISDYQFTPKSLLSGFKIIKQGINLSTANLNNNTNETKFWGVAEKAEALISGDEIVSTTNFLRSDQNSTTNFSFNVRNNNGINIGNDLSFSLGTDTSGSYIYNKVLGASIDIRLRQSTQIKTVLRASINDQTNTGSIGINTLVPTESLDVVGNIKTTGRYITTSTAANSISTTGGINVALNALVGGSLTVSGLTRTANIEPIADSTNILGTEDKRWDTVYAVKVGTQVRPVQVFGTVTGSVNGDVSGFSGGFKTGVTLTLQGDIQGTITIKNDGELKNIDTVLKSDFINQRTESSTYLPNDLLLIERNQSLFKVKKSTIVETLPLVPTATILLFAGNSARVPDGYLICNGEEHSQSIYNNLFSIIGYDYKPQNQLINVGTFAVPNLTPPSPEMRYIIYTGNII